MASRRPPSSRARTNPNGAQNSQRAPSAMGKSSSSQKSDEQFVDNMTSTSSRPAKPVTGLIPSKNSQSQPETNIQVVVRCRRRSEREVQENSPIIVSSNGAKSNQVTIETSPPTSTLGVVTLPPLRTYPFDLVFGPEADQAMIYHEVVAPMLDQVLTGYNCTLFAYGQTGTGKTYTMQGDLAPTPMGNPSLHAGMIPRVLFRLFHHLEVSGADFSVKLSYIELYNEELRDLLAPDSKNSNNSKDAKANEGLKLFDDANKRGVVVQGMEEIQVTTCKEALRVLQRGSDKRQIAATRFNDHSSRSHSIFTITTHVKDTSSLGDDLMKTGKFHLVDLAGSENIGRSGAENQRAREAGMINQSLLTLGRVITALVERASHVPYRESKLTRLLQDSLGGRTRTCLLATVSPARSNLEETLSTLDYALSAKSIRNKPELNQRMTRNALLKEYVAEIERLKADVLAAREKNGIFFAEETWEQITKEQELRQTELLEAKKQVQIVESQLNVLREEFDQSIGMLMKRDEELKDTQKRLADTESALESRTVQLRSTENELEEEKVVRQAHQTGEAGLHTVATGLRGVVRESVRDLGALFDKLERKASVMSSSSKATLKQAKSIHQSTEKLSSSLNSFVQAAASTASQVRSSAQDFGDKELAAFGACRQRIEQQMQAVQATTRTIASHDTEASASLATIQSALADTHKAFESEFKTWGTDLTNRCSQMVAEVTTNNSAVFSEAENAIKAMAQMVDEVITFSLQFTEAERQAASESQVLVAESVKEQIKWLKHQNGVLTRTVEAEKAKSEQAKDELIQRISGLLGQFVVDRDKELRKAVQGFQSSSAQSQEHLTSLENGNKKIMDSITDRCDTMNSELQGRQVRSKRTREGTLKIFKQAQTEAGQTLTSMHQELSSSVSTYSTAVRERLGNMHESGSKALEQHHRAKRARVDATNSMVSKVQADSKALQRDLDASSNNLNTFVRGINAQGSNLEDRATGYHQTSTNIFSSLHQATTALADIGANEDLPTGSTPRKRVWQYVDQWEVTGTRQDILSSWRRDLDKGAENETTPPKSKPQPSGERSVPDPSAPEEGMEVVMQEPTSPTPVPVELPLAAAPRVVSRKASKIGVPGLGTLTDAGNIYTLRHGRKR